MTIYKYIIFSLQGFKNTMKQKTISSIIFINMLTACSPTYIYRGTNIEKEDIKEIKIGKSTQDDVIALFGKASAQTINPKINVNKSIYVWKVLKEKTFTQPQLVEQKVLTIEFDRNLKVKAIDLKEGLNGLQLKHHEEITKTAGQDISLWKEVFSNFGRHVDPQKVPGQ